MQAGAASAAVVVATAALGQLGDDDDVRARRGALIEEVTEKLALIKDFIPLTVCIRIRIILILLYCVLLLSRSWYYVLYVLNINIILIRIAYCRTLS